MAGRPLPGEEVPADGSLPAGALDPERPLSLYVHVPYCRTRCGYCDFNTYTALELARPGTVAPPGSAMDTYVDVVLAELDLALGRAWDDELEPFRYAGEGAPVRWLHRVG